MNRYAQKYAGAIALVIGALLGCSQRPAPVTLRAVRVRLDWTPWAPHVALYTARSRGFFQKEGLRVSAYVPPDPEATTQLVASGRDDIGVSYMTDVILAREQGFDVVSIGALVQHPLNCIMTLKTSGITSISGLKGKVIGTSGAPSDTAFLDGVLGHGGLSRHDVKLVNLGFNLAPALKSRKVDAIIGAYWPWEGIKLEDEGYPVTVFKLQDYGVPDYYELVLITRGELLRNEPSMIAGFLRAAVKGQDYAAGHPDEAVQILKSESPDLSAAFLKSSLDVMLPLMAPEAQRPAFYQDVRIWSRMIEFMRNSGLLKRPVDPRRVFTDRFSP